MQAHEALARSLPLASVNRMSGLIEIIAAAPYGGQAELDTLAGSLSLEINELFPIAEALHILEFAELKGRALKLTAAGRVFAHGTTEERKRLFREHLLRFVPLSAHICRVLRERKQGRAPRLRFEIEMEDHLSRRDTERTLRAVIAWGALRRALRLRRQEQDVLADRKLRVTRDPAGRRARRAAEPSLLFGCGGLSPDPAHRSALVC